MYWFFTPPFWMDNSPLGTCDYGCGFVDTGWHYEANVAQQYGGRGTGRMTCGSFSEDDHNVDTIDYGRPDGDGDGEGWLP